jgi:ABC-type Co2+ transport system permease subunit
MRKMLPALAAAAAIALVTVALPVDANAGHRRGHAVAAGVLGGLAAGAIIGGVLAQPGPVYVAPGPAPVYVEPECRIVRERWWDGYVWRVRRVEVC